VTARFFYDPTVRYHQQRRERAEVPDELLADDEAVRLAYAEQRRRPVDLIGRDA
jgi:hypothetical protein